MGTKVLTGRVARFCLLANEAEWIALVQSSAYNCQTLAQLCHISSRQLRRDFHERYGRSPKEWMAERRMLAAGARLKEVGCVKQVAFELGFKQVSHFCHEFKEFYKVCPSEYLQMAFSEMTHWNKAEQGDQRDFCREKATDR